MYHVREISCSDYSKKYMSLINYFTKNPSPISYSVFCDTLDKILSNSTIFVIEKNNIIIATIKLLFEQKLHNNCSSIAHIEDFVVHPDYRNLGLGKSLVDKCISTAKSSNCYKLTLNCNPDLAKYYTNRGLIQKGLEFSYYFF